MKDINALFKKYEEFMLVNFDDNEMEVISTADNIMKLTEVNIPTFFKYNKDIHYIKEKEELSLAVKVLLDSSYSLKAGYDKDIGKYGFKNGEELEEYAKWVVKEFDKIYEMKERAIVRKLKEEKELSKKEIKNRYIRQKELEIKILENIFDFQAKSKYCREANQYSTIYSEVKELERLYNIVYPICQALNCK